MFFFFTVLQSTWFGGRYKSFYTIYICFTDIKFISHLSESMQSIYVLPFISKLNLGLSLKKNMTHQTGYVEPIKRVTQEK